MKILAISGSARAASTNTALLGAVARLARPDHSVTLFTGLAALPVFSPDLEGETLPANVQQFADMIRESDALLIASPEYVHAIPGGLKNAIDWLVSRDEIASKPIALIHASHRGDEMLSQLRRVLSTISPAFAPDLFLRFDLMKLTPDQVAARMGMAESQAAVRDFLGAFARHCAG
jgi:chromate reductase, NAD(P)H dehydrogenase (quinone)